MLAAHFEDRDTVSQWMAHHLAELVLAAHNEATTTVEQRQQIVETILKVWAHRRDYPGRAPLEDFSAVFAALDHLGDDRPWKFSRPFDADTEVPDPSTSGLPLLATAAELERLTRETLLRLIWLATQNAEEANQEWLEAADKAASNLESEVTTILSRLYRRAARPSAVEGDPREVVGTLAEDTEGDAEITTEDLTEGTAAYDIAESDFEHGGEDLFDDEDDYTSNPLSDINHVKRLREMVGLLNMIADTLSTQDPINEEQPEARTSGNV
jgi:hypothetical protein